MASYSGLSKWEPASLHQATSSLVLPAMAETTTATSWPRIDLAFDVGRDVADVVDVGDGRAAEFHHQTRQRVLGSSKGRRAARAMGRGGV